MAEMEHFGQAYTVAVVENARALATELAGCGVPVLGEDMGFTESHQVLINCNGYGSPAAVALHVVLSRQASWRISSFASVHSSSLGQV